MKYNILVICIHAACPEVYQYSSQQIKNIFHYSKTYGTKIHFYRFQTMTGTNWLINHKYAIIKYGFNDRIRRDHSTSPCLSLKGNSPCIPGNFAFVIPHNLLSAAA